MDTPSSSSMLSKLTSKVISKTGLMVFGVLAVVLVPVLVLGILIYRDSRISVKDVSITNVTDSAFTVTWVSDEKYVGRVYYQEGNKSWPMLFAQSGKSVSYDDRDVELIDDGTYAQVDDGVKERYTHHVTIRNLKPETEYSFRIGGSINGKEAENDSIITSKIIQDINTPDPAYGEIKGVNKDGDAFVIAQYGLDKVASTVVSKNATYTVDMGYFTKKVDPKSDLIVVYVDKGKRITTNLKLDKYKPLKTIDLSETTSGSVRSKLVLGISAQGLPEGIIPGGWCGPCYVKVNGRNQQTECPVDYLIAHKCPGVNQNTDNVPANNDNQVNQPSNEDTAGVVKNDCTNKNCGSGTCFTGDNLNDGGWGCDCGFGRRLGPSMNPGVCVLDEYQKNGQVDESVNTAIVESQERQEPDAPSIPSIPIANQTVYLSLYNLQGECATISGGGVFDSVVEKCRNGSLGICFKGSNGVEYFREGTYGGVDQCKIKHRDIPVAMNNIPRVTPQSDAEVNGNVMNQRTESLAAGSTWAFTISCQGSGSACSQEGGKAANLFKNSNLNTPGYLFQIENSKFAGNKPLRKYIFLSRAECENYLSNNGTSLLGQFGQEMCQNSSNVNKNLSQKVSAQSATPRGEVLGAADQDSIDVEDSGRYVFFQDGEAIAEQDIIVGGDNVSVKLFTDTNGNGVKDASEKYFDDYSQIKIAKEASAESYTLNSGWNLINIPMVDTRSTSPIRSAGDLIDYWNKQGADIKHIARFTDGKFQMFSKRESGTEYSTDFQLLPGQAIFVLNLDQQKQVSFSGNKFEDSVPLNLQQGWNLVGIIAPGRSYTSETLIEKMEEAGVKADTVSQFENGLYKSQVKEAGTVFGNSFKILDQRGYFVRVSEGGGEKFTP